MLPRTLIPCSVAAALALSAGVACAQTGRTVTYDIKGLEGELLSNVKAHVGSTEESRPAEVRRRLRTAIRDGLRAYGYYAPEIRIRQTRDEKKNVFFTAEVQAGEQVRLAAPELKLTGPAVNEPDFAVVFGKAAQAGDPLNHGAYEAFKSDILTAALQHGFFEGRFTQKALEVSPDRLLARWKLSFESGPQYKFGKITYTGSQIREEYLAGLQQVHEGDAYDYTDFADISRRLSETGWFASVAMHPDFEAARADPEKKLPIEVQVTPRKRNIVETGLGYASDIGAHAKLKWSRPWSNSHGHSWDVTADVSSKQQSLDFSYRIPTKSDPLGDYWLAQSGYKYTDLHDTRSSQLAASFSHFELFDSGWTRQIGLNFLWDDYTQAEVDNTAMIIYPGISFSRTRTRGGTAADWGDSQRYALYVSNGVWGSEADFVMFEGSQTWLRTYALKHRIVARASAGWIETDDLNGVPPDLRFFAGGDMSVRGYDYESISPKNDKGELTGGSKMFTASIEYQYNITGAWWGAVFFDAGDAVNKWGDFSFKKGAGAGVRWNSPIGPIKFDVAVPVGGDESRSPKFYVGLGGVL